MLSKKGKEFLTLLKEAGISEYYASEKFNLEEEKPKGTILLPIKSGTLLNRIDDVLNEIDCDEESFTGYVWIHNSSNTDKLNEIRSRYPNLQRRSV